jgi:hypothetical protein
MGSDKEEDMKTLRTLSCLAMVMLIGCVDPAPEAAPTAQEATAAELRSQLKDTITPLGDPVSTARACATFDDWQDDLYCYGDDLGYICCSAPCPGCFRQV